MVYVDDLLLLSVAKKDGQETLEGRPPSFLAKDLEQVSYYLGFHITRDPPGMGCRARSTPLLVERYRMLRIKNMREHPTCFTGDDVDHKQTTDRP